MNGSAARCLCGSPAQKSFPAATLPHRVRRRKRKSKPYRPICPQKSRRLAPYLRLLSSRLDMQRERSSRSAITVSSGRSSSRTSSPPPRSLPQSPQTFRKSPVLPVCGRFAEIQLRKRKEPVHERLELCLLGVDRLQITRLRLFILCHTVEQALGVGADRRQRAFEVVRHPAISSCFCCWRLCASNEVFSRAAISSTASQAGLNSSGTT